MSELPYEAPDFTNPEVLNQLTDSLADYIEHEGDQTIYKIRLKRLVVSATDKLKLPGVLGWFKNLIIKYVVAWVYGIALDLVVGFLRGLGKKSG